MRIPALLTILLITTLAVATLGMPSALAHHHHDEDAYNNGSDLDRANEMMSDGHYKTAEHQYNQMLQTQPGNPNAPYAMMGVAQAQLRMGRTQDAQQTLSQLQAQYPQFAPAYRLQGELFETQGKDSEATAAYRQYVRGMNGQIPPDPEFMLKLRQRGLF